MRLLIATLAAAVAAAPASATVMPHPTAVIVLEPRPLHPVTRAGFERLLVRLEEDDVLARGPSHLPTGPVVACARQPAAQRGPCVRRILSRPSGSPVAVHVAVIVEALPQGRIRMTCIGPGKAMRYPRAQSGVVVDLVRALSVDRATNAIARRDAEACIRVAGEERYGPPRTP